MVVFFELHGDHRDLHVLTHSFPTRRSSDLVRVIAPPTLMPEAIEQMSATAFTDFDEGLEGADVVMMLRLQHERMDGAFIPSPREYHMLYGLTPERLARARPDADRKDVV